MHMSAFLRALSCSRIMSPAVERKYLAKPRYVPLETLDARSPADSSCPLPSSSSNSRAKATTSSVSREKLEDDLEDEEDWPEKSPSPSLDMLMSASAGVSSLFSDMSVSTERTWKWELLAKEKWNWKALATK